MGIVCNFRQSRQNTRSGERLYKKSCRSSL